MPAAGNSGPARALGEDKLRRVIDSALDGMIVIDSSETVLLCNDACERLFGYPAEEVLGTNVKMVMTKMGAGSLSQLVRMTLAAGIDPLGDEAVPTRGARQAFRRFDDCRIRPVSLCAALSDIGGTVVPSFRIAEQSFPAGHHIVAQGESGRDFCVIVDGWAVQYELLQDGGRQILDFLLPGSVAGLQPDGEARSPHYVQALTDVRACRFSRAGFLVAATSNPELALRLASIASRSHYRSLRHLTLIGRRTAKARVAELLFELYRRVRRLSLSPCEDEVSLPLTQEHIGDALGLTNVHVNRMLRELREEGVLVLKNGVLRLLDRVRLIEMVDCGDHRYAWHS